MTIALLLSLVVSLFCSYKMQHVDEEFKLFDLLWGISQVQKRPLFFLFCLFFLNPLTYTSLSISFNAQKVARPLFFISAKVKVTLEQT